MGREKHDDKHELNYHLQMQMIITTGIVDTLKPTIINPFDETGVFRSIEEITSDILAGLHAEHKNTP